jgi:hypothetical protein
MAAPKVLGQVLLSRDKATSGKRVDGCAEPLIADPPNAISASVLILPASRGGSLSQ